MGAPGSKPASLGQVPQGRRLALDRVEPLDILVAPYSTEAGADEVKAKILAKYKAVNHIVAASGSWWRGSRPRPPSPSQQPSSGG